MNRVIFPVELLILVSIVAVLGCTKQPDLIVSKNPVHGNDEYWELLTLDGKPIGFQRNQWSKEEIEGRPITRFVQESRMLVLRHGNRFEATVNTDSISTREGELISCRSRLDGGNTSIEIRCEIEDGKLRVLDASHREPLVWVPGTPGPDALIRCLLNKPMSVGEKRNIVFFEPTRCGLIETSLHAEGIESVNLNTEIKTESKTKISNLLRISVENTLKKTESAESTEMPEPIFSGTLWTDRSGNIIRTEMSLGQSIVAERTDRESVFAALNENPQTEWGNVGIVPLNQPLNASRTDPQITFLVQVKNGSPADRFPETPFQKIIPVNKNTAKIVVRSALSPDGSLNGHPIPQGAKSNAGPGDLSSNALIDLDDPQLKMLSDSVDTASLTPWQTALAMERLVHETIRKTSFSIAFASSSETLKTQSGDCTEFAVLLAALCRSKKIPTRLTLGLVYISEPPGGEKETPTTTRAGMAFHLWNEVLIEGLWRPLDATAALGGADAARIKIADNALSEGSPGLLADSIIGLIGQLTINIPER